jgi:hypothetical protein
MLLFRLRGDATAESGLELLEVFRAVEEELPVSKSRLSLCSLKGISLSLLLLLKTEFDKIKI